MVGDEVWCQLRIVNRTSSTGSQRGYIGNVSNALNGIHIVDLQKESVLASANTIECHGSDFLTLTPTECREITGEPNSVQFRLANRESHRFGALDTKNK